MLGLRILSEEGLLLLLSLVGLGALVGLGEILRTWGVSVRTTRRLVHVGVSLFVAATPLLFARPLPVYGLAALFVVLNAGARFSRWWPGIHAARPRSWGTVALPLSVLPALAATWSVGPERIIALHAAYLVIGLADPAASGVGERQMPQGLTRPTTYAGSFTFAGIALSVTTLLLVTATPWPVGRSLGAALGTAAVATLVEAISHRGWDNFFVVLSVIAVLVPIGTGTLAVPQLFGALLIGGAFGLLAYWTRALDARGAATGGLFAASLVGLGGGPWIVPGLVFFGGSSALTGLAGDVQQVAGRTRAQVLANGGVAWTALTVGAVLPGGGMGDRLAYAAFVGALAAAAADTWATEIGKGARTSPWSLREGRRVPPGTSGAVSLLGTGGALLGAGSVVGSVLLCGGESPIGSMSNNALLLCGAGMLGMIADSVAGAVVQGQYRDPSGGWTERPPAPDAVPERGWAPVGNNAVNLICTSVGALAALGGVFLIG